MFSCYHSPSMNDSIRNQIKKKLKNRGYTQKSFAQEFGLSEDYVGKVLRGERVEVPEGFQKMLDALDFELVARSKPSKTLSTYGEVEWPGISITMTDASAGADIAIKANDVFNIRDDKTMFTVNANELTLEIDTLLAWLKKESSADVGNDKVFEAIAFLLEVSKQLEESDTFSALSLLRKKGAEKVLSFAEDKGATTIVSAIHQ